MRAKDQTKRDLRAAGACIDCGGRPWRPRAWRCRACQDAENLRQRIVLDETRAFGLCYACGRDAKPGRIRCEVCATAETAANRIRRRARRIHEPAAQAA